MTALAGDIPDVGQFARVRGQQWVVARRYESAQPVDELAASQPTGRNLVTLNSVRDDDLGQELTLAWEVEPGREVLPETRLPNVTATGWGDTQIGYHYTTISVPWTVSKEGHIMFLDQLLEGNYRHHAEGHR